MGLLKDHGVDHVFHFTPLHYIPFISRSKGLLSKPSLKKAGFPAKHVRSMSAHHDVERGFGGYAHLTLAEAPRILKAKLAAGFPHIAIRVSGESIDGSVDYSLCRFNVAMTRYLRRDGKPGFEESAINGRYYTGHQIPIARTQEDKASMLSAFVGTHTMIEVLVHGDLPLSDDTRVICYSEQDADTAKLILESVGTTWPVETLAAPSAYPSKTKYQASVANFIEKALSDPTWRGDGLEFDRV